MCWVIGTWFDTVLALISVYSQLYTTYVALYNQVGFVPGAIGLYTLTLLSCTGYELLYTAHDIYTLYTDYELQSALLVVLFRFSTRKVWGQTWFSRLSDQFVKIRENEFESVSTIVIIQYTHVHEQCFIGLSYILECSQPFIRRSTNVSCSKSRYVIVVEPS